MTIASPIIDALTDLLEHVQRQKSVEPVDGLKSRRTLMTALVDYEAAAQTALRSLEAFERAIVYKDQCDELEEARQDCIYSIRILIGCYE